MQSLREVTPIDSLVMSILSKNTSPVDVASRIDNFLIDFRRTIESMPSSEIRDHATSLSKQLRKPVQHLSDEASIQVSFCFFNSFLLNQCQRIFVIFDTYFSQIISVLQNSIICS
jgi:secreted Zn-dependent insulinase-like peptidase